MMRIGIFSQWYDPEPGPAAAMTVPARELAARGHEVDVLTGFPNYPTGVLVDGYRQSPRARETLGGVHVTRVPLYPSHDRSALHRLANYASFGLSAAALGVPSLPPLDVLWVDYSPITLALPMWLQQLLHGTPTTCQVLDLWPDTVEVSGLDGAELISRFTRSVLDRWCDAIYASSDAVTYISPGVGRLLADRGVAPERLHFIPLSADEGLFHPGGRSLRGELGLEAATTILLFAGSMGGAQGVEALLDACALVPDPRLVVLLAGSGTHERELRERAAALNLSAVHWLGRLPQDRMTDLLATADLAYIPLAPHPLSAVTMPSKTQSTLAAGRAILAAADGDLAAVVAGNGVGFTATPGDPRSIAAAIRAALDLGNDGLARMGQRSRQTYLAQFSVDRTVTLMEDLLTDVAASGRRPARRRFTPVPPRAPREPVAQPRHDLTEGREA